METKTCSKCNIAKPTTHEFYASYLIKGTYKIRSECRDCSRKMCRDYKAKNHELISDYNKQYKASHKDDTRNYNRDYFAKRRLDPKFKIKAYNRSRISMAMHGIARESSTDLLSCSYEEFVKWLIYQFDENMTMDNYGTYWHLDHVIPCASFDLIEEIAQKQCFHWSNYRPCEGTENLSKGDKIDNEVINWHKDMIAEFLSENQYDMSFSLYK
jgi:hypothetical protein